MSMKQSQKYKSFVDDGESYCWCGLLNLLPGCLSDLLLWCLGWIDFYGHITSDSSPVDVVLWYLWFPIIFFDPSYRDIWKQLTEPSLKLFCCFSWQAKYLIWCFVPVWWKVIWKWFIAISAWIFRISMRSFILIVPITRLQVLRYSQRLSFTLHKRCSTRLPRDSSEWHEIQ